MRVLVTGADGFVGRHLCALLADAGDVVRALRGPAAGDASADRIDVRDAGAVRRAIEAFAPEQVIHLAGVASVAWSHEHPVETWEVNAVGAMSVCAAVRAAAPKAKVLLVGSGEVYGRLAEGARANETMPALPTSPYGASKVAAEEAARQVARAYEIHVVLARPFNHLGRGQTPAFAIPSFARKIEGVRRSGAPGTISVGNLEPVRDFSHVSDVVQAYRLLVERGASGEIYNVSSGEGRTIRSVLEEMIRMSGANVTVEVDPAKFRAVEIPWLVGDSSKARALGWTPRKTASDALRDSLDEAREEAAIAAG